jgi:hypothetical protein
LPIVATSSEEGQQLATVWTTGLHTPASALVAELNQVAAGAAHAYQQVVALRPPVNVAGAAGLLEACLLVRSEAAMGLRNALHPVLLDGAGSSVSSATGPQAVAAIQAAGNDLQVGDQAYQLFTRSLPKLGVTMPPSVWATNAAPYQSDAAQVFLMALQSAMSTTPLHQVKIYALTTSPPAESIRGGIRILPDQATMSVTVVIADVGNQPEKNLTVKASIAPGGESSSVVNFVNLVAGQAYTVVGMGPLTPPEGVTVTLTVGVMPPAGSTTPPVTQTLVFMMPAPSPTTTTLGVTTTTTPSG